MIRVRYFARLREELGLAEEEIEATAGSTVGSIRDGLRDRGEPWARAFAADSSALAAVNQEMARPETPVADGDEVAFFPPVTGG